jgi:hypothetical protein
MDRDLIWTSSLVVLNSGVPSELHSGAFPITGKDKIVPLLN